MTEMKTLAITMLMTLIPAASAAQDPRDTLRELERQDSVISVYAEPEQRAALTWALALAQDPGVDEVARAAAYARLGRWSRSMKNPEDRRRAVLALCAALRARPAAERARFRPAVLDALREASWPFDPGVAARAREALAVTLADKSLLSRERRQAETLSALLSETYAAAR